MSENKARRCCVCLWRSTDFTQSSNNCLWASSAHFLIYANTTSSWQVSVVQSCHKVQSQRNVLITTQISVNDVFFFFLVVTTFFNYEGSKCDWSFHGLWLPVSPTLWLKFIFLLLYASQTLFGASPKIIFSFLFWKNYDVIKLWHHHFIKDPVLEIYTSTLGQVFQIFRVK